MDAERVKAAWAAHTLASDAYERAREVLAEAEREANDAALSLSDAKDAMQDALRAEPAPAPVPGVPAAVAREAGEALRAILHGWRSVKPEGKEPTAEHSGYIAYGKLTRAGVALDALDAALAGAVEPAPKPVGEFAGHAVLLRDGWYATFSGPDGHETLGRAVKYAKSQNGTVHTLYAVPLDAAGGA